VGFPDGRIQAEGWEADFETQPDVLLTSHPQRQPDLNGVWRRPYVPNMDRNGGDQKGRAEDRFFIRDFFVFLQENSTSSILAKEFGKCNIPETQ